MSDIIKLLPDAVANQIAAGEVIQRPASAVKELLENAVDSGATKIQLIVKDAGRTLIQVVDNGKGMSFHDSRLCFERHATSKLTCADDLFSIRTKGFRGEALASIAAIAHVELKTKQADSDTGTRLLVEGSEVKEHSPVATQNGSSFAVKNLFFNVPARRNFLKSDAVEFGHMEEEFYRVALVHNDIAFTLIHNDKTLLQLQPSNFKQRIINIFGAHFRDKLYPMELETEQVAISGFIAKPENAKKKKSEQYLFVNERFVKHYLLTHAIETAYAMLIPDGYKPAFFIYLDIDPRSIDINISPTKVDVKLQDERLIFGFLNSAVKKAIGSLTLTPQLDFERDKSFDFTDLKKDTPSVTPLITHNPDYNPFTTQNNSPFRKSQSSPNSYKENYGKPEGWDNFLKGINKVTLDLPSGMNGNQEIVFEKKTTEEIPEVNVQNWVMVANKFLILPFLHNLTIIHIPYAHERILYESYLSAMEDQPVFVQQSLFPETVTLSAGCAEILVEIKPELYKLGYDIEAIDRTNFAINGTPSTDDESDLQTTIENFVDSYKCNSFLHHDEKEKNIALCMAKQKRSRLKPLESEAEVNDFLKKLYQCGTSDITPSGKKIIHTLSMDNLSSFFGGKDC
ncbi:MAG: DNA mismatch repair endonuclease MutL [Bacteroidales bacterium]|jgi:DNA mismatch repair protein MutL|nr:DNA mismatch repair endonuclease MutL [Bacteroidales bacterium]